MKVLSLFDGISCGRIALERVGIPVEKYYASEIEPNAIKISEKNYPDIILLGDVTKWREWVIPWSEIDLLIGGSPCQGFSFAGKGLNFEDPRSKLFFTYVDILNHIKGVNPKVKFLLENVKMKKEYENVITDYLNTLPYSINSNCFSAQYRQRLYWTNFDVDDGVSVTETKIKDILQPLKDVDKSYYHKRTIEYFRSSTFSQESKLVQDVNKKCDCLLARDYKDPKSVVQDGVLRRLTPIEYERLQTVPDNYTDIVCKSKRYEALGNGWTVDVIAHILKGLKEE